MQIETNRPGPAQLPGSAARTPRRARAARRASGVCAGALCASLGLAAVCAGVAADGRDDALAALDPALRACAERVLPGRTMVQKQRVRVISGEGWVRESFRTVYWKRFDDDTMKVLFRVDEPVSEKGLKVLMIMHADNDPVLYVYSPDTRRARRMVGTGASNSILGTDFTYEDAMHFESFFEAGNTSRLPDADVDARRAFVLETTPDADASAYASIRTYIDVDDCVPIRTEFYGRSGSLDKTLLADRDSVTQIQGRHIPLRTVMINHKQDSRTEFVLSRIEIDLALPDRLFTFAEIAKSQ